VQYNTCAECGAHLDPGCDCQKERSSLDDSTELFLRRYADMQNANAGRADLIPCPRCGRYRMKQRLHTNAASRHFKGITVCDGCGRDEAMQDFHGVVLPNEEWAVVQKFQCEREWPYETQEE
jgi:hypothetical protein